MREIKEATKVELSVGEMEILLRAADIFAELDTLDDSSEMLDKFFDDWSFNSSVFWNMIRSIYKNDRILENA